MKTILYIKLSDSSFIAEDENILKDVYNVEPFTLDTTSRFNFALSLLKMTFWTLKRIRSSYVIYSFFVSWYLIIPAVLCRVAGIPLVLSVGGFDANWLPALGYGVYNKKISRFLCGFIYRSASIILPVHESLIRVENKYSEYNIVREGFMNLFAGIRGQIVVIPSGFDTDFWSSEGAGKETIVLSVGTINNRLNFKLKGMADFVEAARRIPEYQFFHIGNNNRELFDELVKEPPKNLTLLGFVNSEELLSWYRRSKVYAQLSISEGLPNSLIQAMLCECIPVGSAVNGIPDIIDNTGFVIPRRDADLIEKAIRKAMVSDSGKKARERAVNNYSFSTRHEKLTGVFRELMSNRQ